MKFSDGFNPTIADYIYFANEFDELANQKILFVNPQTMVKRLESKFWFGFFCLMACQSSMVI